MNEHDGTCDFIVLGPTHDCDCGGVQNEARALRAENAALKARLERVEKAARRTLDLTRRGGAAEARNDLRAVLRTALDDGTRRGWVRLNFEEGRGEVMCFNHAWGNCGSCAVCRMNQRNPTPPEGHGGHHEPTREQREYREKQARETSAWRAKRERIADLKAEIARLEKDGE